MRDLICSVLHPLVVSAFTEEIPVTKMRDADRVSPRAWMQHSDTYDSSDFCPIEDGMLRGHLLRF